MLRIEGVVRQTLLLVAAVSMHGKWICATTPGYDYYSTPVPVRCDGTPNDLQTPFGWFGIMKNQYENYLSCYWKIQVGNATLLHLTFDWMDIEFSTDCRCDSVKVYDGEDIAAPLLGTFCGSSLQGDIFTSSGSVFVAFESDDYGTGEGFQISYNSLDSIPGGCFGNPAILAGSGRSFGIDENQYMNNMKCSWRIIAGDMKKTIHLEFMKLDTECEYDNVEVYDGSSNSSQLLGLYCDENEPGEVIYSTGNTMLVAFQPDEEDTYSGFEITYTILDSAADECASDPCMNGATCLGDANGFICTCKYGFTGSSCETATDECARDPCMNGATCLGDANGFTCTCKDGFTGSSCETDATAGGEDSCTNGHNNCDPTFQGGVCTADLLGSGFTCSCRDAWIQTGETRCMHKCDAEYCLNGATCNKAEPERPICVCTDEYEGERCSVKTGFLSGTMMYVVGGGAGGSVLLLVGAVIVCCICMRKTAQGHGGNTAIPVAVSNLPPVVPRPPVPAVNQSGKRPVIKMVDESSEYCYIDNSHAQSTTASRPQNEYLSLTTMP